jgi:hypothetical protein
MVCAIASVDSMETSYDDKTRLQHPQGGSIQVLSIYEVVTLWEGLYNSLKQSHSRKAINSLTGQEIPHFYGAGSFIIVLTKAHHVYLGSRARVIQSTPVCFIPLMYKTY